MTLSAAFEWTDDPDDPCPYCVQWDEPEQMDSSNFDQAIPMLPNGPAARVYRFTHHRCERAVMQYVSGAAL